MGMLRIDRGVATAALILMLATASGCQREASVDQQALSNNVEMPAEESFYSEEHSDAAPVLSVEARPGYNAAARSAGVDPETYAEDASKLEVKPNEMLAAELIVCREIGDCPTGMTRESARKTICDRTADC